MDDLRARGLARLEVACAKCGRRGAYVVEGLIEQHGGDFMLTDFLDEQTADCARRGPHAFLDQCGAHFPALARP